MSKAMNCKHCSRRIVESVEGSDTYLVDYSNSAKCPVNAYMGHESESHTSAGVARLAETLMSHTGADPEEQRDNYLADAREIAALYPHLLTLDERGEVNGSH